MKKDLKEALKAFCVELPVYAVLVGIYLWVAMRYLGPWLSHLFHDHRAVYAAAALGLIVTQGLLLEIIERALMALGRGRNGK